MYNRILKRPMFKRGGSSFQAQGTGITSPYDTPRKRYAEGPTYEDIYSQIRETTKDPRSDWSYAAEGFGHLGSPYKDDGSAKMISEMLHEGAAGVRGSKEKASQLERTGELAVLESQGGRLAAEEAHKRKLEEIAEAGKWKEQELKRIPLARLITEIEQAILKNAVPGSFQHTYSPGLATGRAIKRRKSADGIAVGVIEVDRWTKDKGKWDYIADNMSSTIPWFDPVNHQWHVFNDDGNGMATGAPVKSFLTVDEALAYIKGGNQKIIEESQTLDENNAEGTRSSDKKLVKTGRTWEEMQEDVVQVSDIVDKVTDPKTWEGTVGGDARGYGLGADTYAKKAEGGRIGYKEGTDDPATELDLLNNWWRTMQANDWKE
jgi:hypothetical protein